MLLNHPVQQLQLPLVQSLEVRQGDRRIEPELRFAVGGQYVNVYALFLSGKEEEEEAVGGERSAPFARRANPKRTEPWL